MEWLAFEIDYAEMFTLGKFCHSQSCRDNDDPNDPPLRPPHHPGYVHVYETNRDLNKLLYIDGMSAAKSALGTLDSQDLLLLNSSLDPFAECDRATRLCDWRRTFGIEGFIRMEAGFEIILCNFTGSLNLVSCNKRPASDSKSGFDNDF